MANCQWPIDVWFLLTLVLVIEFFDYENENDNEEDWRNFGLWTLDFGL
jgi:hypothetical protein